jgi:hypothetical protein
VLRAIVKKATGQHNRVLGALMPLTAFYRTDAAEGFDLAAVSGIHVRGGTIIGTQIGGSVSLAGERSDGRGQ